MPGLDGIAAAAALRPCCRGFRVLVLTTFGRPGYLRRAIDAGARGFIVKDAPSSNWRTRSAGSWRGRVVDPALAAATLAGGPSSPPRAGRAPRRRRDSTVADIAHRLLLFEGTVRNHLSSAIAKTGARNRAEAVSVAEANGWL